jgi:hypothetical protein
MSYLQFSLKEWGLVSGRISNHVWDTGLDKAYFFGVLRELSVRYYFQISHSINKKVEIFPVSK